ncbi:hypothetical protein PFISCL1PPCAC_16931, partial [Pristionchus fissidentatus]
RLGASGRLSRSLQADEHDHVGLALLRRERFDSRVKQLEQLLQNGLLDESPLVHSADHVVEVHLFLDIVLELRDETDVHIGFDESSAHL